MSDMLKREVSEKELFYEADTRKHQQAVMSAMAKCIHILMNRGLTHDASKLTSEESEHYIEPVWQLNTQDVPYGSERYKELTTQMGEGWEHHKRVNDHHPKDLKDMSLLSLLEMVWIAAAQRKGNNPADAIKYMKPEPSEELESILLNTLAEIREQVVVDDNLVVSPRW
jgi:hypothetical protein